jgi:CheY-like chemotaxis protein
MTTGKRALIVDDSRSARVILSRMLEQHGMVVDTAESAEQALEYLQQGRPDVIFMDHLMPGMDGFQAVQAIKSDVQTATIPLMMYTSQEGELYVSQARALGAIGVLPKTVRPVDVSRVLYQLHLLPDRRQQRTTLFERAAATALSAAQPALAPAPGSQEMPLVGAEATLDETAAAGTAAWSGTPVGALA